MQNYLSRISEILALRNFRKSLFAIMADLNLCEAQTMQKSFQSDGQRISIVGTSGSGKTTLARQVAQQLQIPHIELDELHWEPN